MAHIGPLLPHDNIEAHLIVEILRKCVPKSP